MKILILLTVLFLVGCQADEEVVEMGIYQRITPEEAKELMDGSSIILDVRTQEEFDTGYIEGAILLPHSEIENLATSMLPDKSQTILVYCRSGNRSQVASRKLIELGYTNVYDFGGINTWIEDLVK